jgi:hypothetical protein
MSETLNIRGQKFELTIRRQPDHPVGWQWILAAPGKLVLSGEAASQDLAERSARRAGRTLARSGPE